MQKQTASVSSDENSRPLSAQSDTLSTMVQMNLTYRQSSKKNYIKDNMNVLKKDQVSFTVKSLENE